MIGDVGSFNVLVTARGGGNGGWVGIVQQTVECLPHRFQVFRSQDDAGAHYSPRFDCTAIEQGVSVGPNVSERQVSKSVDYGDVELSVAQQFWNVVRVSYWVVHYLVGHCALRALKQSLALARHRVFGVTI